MILGSKYMRSNNKRPGFTLIEVIVYVALLGVVMVFVANSVVFLVTTYARARAEREVLTNARAVLDRVTSRVAAAQETYGFTSVFDANAGQLSLMTATTMMSGHTVFYTDIWVDSGVAYLRDEGAETTTLSAGSVRITVLKFERIAQALGREAVRMTVRADAVGARFPASATLTTTTALRGNY